MLSSNVCRGLTILLLQNNLDSLIEEFKKILVQTFNRTTYRFPGIEGLSKEIRQLDPLDLFLGSNHLLYAHNDLRLETSQCSEIRVELSKRGVTEATVQCQITYQSNTALL